MSAEILPVSVVIPVLNEAATLPALLSALANQTAKPQELFFIDTGSTDGSLDMVNAWWRREQWRDGSLLALSSPGAYPGGARNAGIERATQPWIAFLDAGVTPDRDWLQILIDSAQTAKPAGVFGLTRFTGRDALTTALCALSYGQGAARATLPGSMFRRDVFARIGGFDGTLRAGEDVVWLRKFDQAYPDGRMQCTAGAVYSHFPESLPAAASKWFDYEQHAARAGLHRGMMLAASAGGLLTIAAFAAQPAAGLAICLLYLVARGVVDPIRRSASWSWWADHPVALVLAPLCALVIDSAKLAGQIAGRLKAKHV